MSEAVERLFDNARLRLPGALDGVLKQELFMTLDEFFRTTNLWKEDMPFTGVAKTRNYSLAPVIGTILRIVRVWSDSDIGFRVSMANPGDIRLAFEPSSTIPMTAQVILTVSDPVDRDSYPQVPDVFYVQYHATILDGLLGRMMSQPAKPYTSEKLSIYHLRRFRDGMARARVDGDHLNLQGGQRWRFPSFGG